MSKHRQVSKVLAEWIKDNDPEFYKELTAGAEDNKIEKLKPNIRDTRDKLDKSRILDAFEYSYNGLTDEGKLELLCKGLEDRENGFHVNDTLSKILKETGFISNVRGKPTKLGKKFYLNFTGKYLILIKEA